MAIYIAKQLPRNSDSAKIIVCGNEEHTVFLTGCACLKESNVTFYLNAMLTPVKKNHLEEKHRWGSGINYWWEGEKEGMGRNLKMGLTFHYEPKVFQSC